MWRFLSLWAFLLRGVLNNMFTLNLFSYVLLAGLAYLVVKLLQAHKSVNDLKNEILNSEKIFGKWFDLSSNEKCGKHAEMVFAEKCYAAHIPVERISQIRGASYEQYQISESEKPNSRVKRPDFTLRDFPIDVEVKCRTSYENNWSLMKYEELKSLERYKQQRRVRDKDFDIAICIFERSKVNNNECDANSLKVIMLSDISYNKTRYYEEITFNPDEKPVPYITVWTKDNSLKQLGAKFAEWTKNFKPEAVK
jgi:hypothetical protein